MTYPRINKKELDVVNKKRFANLYNTIFTQIQFDNKENELKLTKSDMELLAWNTSVVIISQPY